MSFIETMSLLLFARRLATPLLPVLRVAETIDQDFCYLGCLNDNLNPLNRITGLLNRFRKSNIYRVHKKINHFFDISNSFVDVCHVNRFKIVQLNQCTPVARTKEMC